MKYLEAKNLIEEKYELNQINEKSCEISINKLINPFNFAFVSLIDCGDSCILSDMATTVESVQIDEKELKEIAEKCGLVFDDFYIKTDFNSMSDIDKFLNFFDKISQ